MVQIPSLVLSRQLEVVVVGNVMSPHKRHQAGRVAVAVVAQMQARAALHRQQVKEVRAAMDLQAGQIMVVAVAVVQVAWAQMDHLLQAVTVALVLLIQSQAL